MCALQDQMQKAQEYCNPWSESALQGPFKPGITMQDSNDLQCHFKSKESTTRTGNPHDPAYRGRQRGRITYAAAWIIQWLWNKSIYFPWLTHCHSVPHIKKMEMQRLFPQTGKFCWNSSKEFISTPQRKPGKLQPKLSSNHNKRIQRHLAAAGKIAPAITHWCQNTYNEMKYFIYREISEVLSQQ